MARRKTGHPALMAEGSAMLASDAIEPRHNLDNSKKRRR
jgi:hypothetical protein